MSDNFDKEGTDKNLDDKAYQDYLSRFPMDPATTQQIAAQEGTLDLGFEQYNSDKNGVADRVAIDLSSDNSSFVDKFKDRALSNLGEDTHSEKFVDKVTKNISQARRDSARLLVNYNVLKDRFPDEFELAMSKHPDLAAKIDSVIVLLDWIVANSETLSDEELKSKIEEYNRIALSVNNKLRDIWGYEAQGRKDFNMAAANGELGFDEAALSEEEKVEYKQFAKDLFKELFPDSYVDAYVKYYTGQEDLETYQKILLSVANGIESAATGIYALADYRTYIAMYDTGYMLSGMSEDDWLAMWQTAKIVSENLDYTDTIAPSISLMVSMCLFGGGIVKVQQFAAKMGYSQKFTASLPLVIGSVKFAGKTTNVMNKAFPIGIMTGISLPYFKM
jgi:hypothetical protein